MPDTVKKLLTEDLRLQFNHLMEGYAQGLFKIMLEAYEHGHANGEAYAYDNVLTMLDKHANKDGVKA